MKRPSKEEIQGRISDAYFEDVARMMFVQFDEEISVLKDPDTGEETLYKLSGEPITEEEYIALSYFELGWGCALASLDSLGRSYVDEEVTSGYSEEAEEPTHEEDTNDDTGRDD